MSDRGQNDEPGKVRGEICLNPGRKEPEDSPKNGVGGGGRRSAEVLFPEGNSCWLKGCSPGSRRKAVEGLNREMRERGEEKSPTPLKKEEGEQKGLSSETYGPVPIRGGGQSGKVFNYGEMRWGKGKGKEKKSV